MLYHIHAGPSVFFFNFMTEHGSLLCRVLNTFCLVNLYMIMNKLGSKCVILSANAVYILMSNQFPNLFLFRCP